MASRGRPPGLRETKTSQTTKAAHEGLLQPIRSGGLVVRSFNRTDIDDAVELRGVLEGTAARLAQQSLDLVLENHDALARLPGAQLLRGVA